MKVHASVGPVSVHGNSVQTIELGEASWNPAELSIRNRWDTNGGFDPMSSSELPIPDVLLLVKVILRVGILDQAQLRELLTDIAASPLLECAGAGVSIEQMQAAMAKLKAELV